MTTNITPAETEALLDAATPGPITTDDVYGLVAPSKIDGFAFPMERQEAEWAIEADRNLFAAVRDIAALAIEQAERIDKVLPLAESPCENYVGQYTCFDTRRTPDATYGADRYCWPCRLRAALTDRDTEEESNG